MNWDVEAIACFGEIVVPFLLSEPATVENFSVGKVNLTAGQ